MCDEALGVWRTAGGLKDRLMVKKRVVCFLQMKKQLDKSSERGFFFSAERRRQDEGRLFVRVICNSPNRDFWRCSSEEVKLIFIMARVLTGYDITFLPINQLLDQDNSHHRLIEVTHLLTHVRGISALVFETSFSHQKQIISGLQLMKVGRIAIECTC